MGTIRKTKSVKTILQLFEQNENALSVVELVERFKGEANKTTIYRILDRLEQHGLLHSFKGIDGLTWYAKCTGCTADHHHDIHPHFQCQECGKVECLAVSMPLPEITKHQIESASILLTGRCESCLS